MPELKIADAIKSGYINTSNQLWPTFDGKFLDRSKYVTASQVGNCERWIWFDKNTKLLPEVIPEGWGYFARGHNVEAWLVDMLRASEKVGDFRFQFIGEDQRSFYNKYQSGTPDGLAIGPDNYNLGLEFKSIDPRTNVRNLPKEKHVNQVLQNIDLMEQSLDINIQSGIIHYTDASNYANQWEFIVKSDRRKMKELYKKAKRIKKLRKAESTKAEGLYNGDCSLCPFTELCSDAVSKANKANKTMRSQRKLGGTLFK